MIRCTRSAHCAKVRAAFSPSAAPPRRCSRRSPRSPPGDATSRPIWRSALAQSEADGHGKSPLERLSEREFEVFVRLARGQTVQGIAADLKLSASTIGTHLYNIKQKLAVANQSELTLIAIRHGLIQA